MNESYLEVADRQVNIKITNTLLKVGKLAIDYARSSEIKELLRVHRKNS
jgi:hypothetical protein